MRTSIHIALLLIAAVIVGFGVRAVRSVSNRSGAEEQPQMFTNDMSVDEARAMQDSLVVHSSPSHPPEDEAWLSRFELTERSGEIVTSEQLLGQPYIVSFFYSTCPSICVRQNQKLKELQDEFEGQGVRFVAISCDPETDTPEQLREYAARFGADPEQWLFMTGDLTYIRRIGSEIYRQPVDKQFHSERFVLVDSQGEIEGFYSWPDTTQMEKLKTTIRKMIDSTLEKDS